MLIAHNLIWKSYQAEHFSFIAWDDKRVKNKNKIKAYISTFGKRMHIMEKFEEYEFSHWNLQNI